MYIVFNEVGKEIAIIKDLDTLTKVMSAFPTWKYREEVKPAHGSAKVTPEQVEEIRYRKAKGETLKALARDYGISYVAVHKIVKGKTWIGK